MPLPLVFLILALLGLDAAFLGPDAAESAYVHGYPRLAFENLPDSEPPEPEGWQTDDQFDDDYSVEDSRAPAESMVLPADCLPAARRATSLPVRSTAPVATPVCYQLARLLL